MASYLAIVNTFFGNECEPVCDLEDNVKQTSYQEFLEIDSNINAYNMTTYIINCCRPILYGNKMCCT